MAREHLQPVRRRNRKSSFRSCVTAANGEMCGLGESICMPGEMCHLNPKQEDVQTEPKKITSFTMQRINQAYETLSFLFLEYIAHSSDKLIGR